MARQNRPRFCIFLEGPEDGLVIDERTAEITNLLRAWGSGDEAALARLAEHVYPELRRMAHWLGLGDVAASTKGSLARPLRQALEGS